MNEFSSFQVFAGEDQAWLVGRNVLLCIVWSADTLSRTRATEHDDDEDDEEDDDDDYAENNCFNLMSWMRTIHEPQIVIK